jgi:hypothetical protein
MIHDMIDSLGGLKDDPPKPNRTRKKRGEPGPDQIDLFAE